MTAETNTQAGGKKGIPKWAKILAVFFAIILLAFIVVSLIPVPLEGNINVDPRNEQIYSALAANNITDAAIDVTTDRVLVSATVPGDIDATTVKYIVFGAASQIRDPPPIIIVEVFDQDRKLIETSNIGISTVQKYLTGDIGLDELEKSIKRV